MICRNQHCTQKSVYFLNKLDCKITMDKCRLTKAKMSSNKWKDVVSPSDRCLLTHISILFANVNR